MKLWKSHCERKGHEWFPDIPRSEFLPLLDLCLRCRAKRTRMPSGECLNGHPLADHYRSEGNIVPVGDCIGPL